MKFLDRLLPPKEIISLHLTDDKWYAVHLKKDPEKINILDQKILEIPSGIIQKGIIQDEEALIKILETEKDFWAHKKMVISFPFEQTFNTKVSYEGEKKEIEKKEIIESKRKSDIPLEKEKSLIQTHEKKLKEETFIFLCAINKEVKESYEKVFKKQKMKLISIKPEFCGLLNNLKFPVPQDTEHEGFIVIDAYNDFVQWYEIWNYMIVDSNRIEQKEIEEIENDLEKSRQYFTFEHEDLEVSVQKIYITGEEAPLKKVKKILDKKLFKIEEIQDYHLLPSSKNKNRQEFKIALGIALGYWDQDPKNDIDFKD